MLATFPDHPLASAAAGTGPTFSDLAQLGLHFQQQQQQHHHHQMRCSKKSKQDYSNALCRICNAPADGMHYGAISCRSCNAFFRRAITFKQTFLCRKGGNCDVDISVRCACRACRLAKCKAAGMRETDVQPKRDPTGSQKNRRAPQRKRSNFMIVKREMSDGQQSDNSPNSLLPSSVESLGLAETKIHLLMAEENNPYQTMLSLSPSSAVFPPSAESGILRPHSAEELFVIKKEPLDEGEMTMEMEMASSTRRKEEEEGNRVPQSQEEFDQLVRDYGEHLRMINRGMTSIDSFLDEEQGSCSKWRMMEPTDVEQLSKTELSGLMYWIEKLNPFRRLDRKEREVLFKRYSVRKISLDHFYTASKHPELIAKGHFAMPNNTFVPPDRTGFETVHDDKHTREAKFQVMRPTIDRLWHTIVLPFAQLRISDAEMVALHLLLMWSRSNNRHVSERTCQLMQLRREWTCNCLLRHYASIGQPEPVVRLGEVLLLLPELEVICDIHCKDFQVAQLFEFCNMSDYWYESTCYSSLNIA